MDHLLFLKKLVPLILEHNAYNPLLDVSKGSFHLSYVYLR